MGEWGLSGRGGEWNEWVSGGLVGDGVSGLNG